jgi:hypothetical protein
MESLNGGQPGHFHSVDSVYIVCYIEAFYLVGRHFKISLKVIPIMKLPKSFQPLIEAPKQAMAISIIALLFSAIALIMVMGRNHGA